ncbi:MAG: VIT domain-containing protein [Sulfuricurvum sp.]
MIKHFVFLVLWCMTITDMAYAAHSTLMETIGGEKPITLQTLSITTDVSGSMAKTTLRMAFYNPNARQLEGNLHFPLPEGAHVIGFALDFEGKMRPAVPVEKNRGKAIFEAIERTHADPALLEKNQGNNFTLRVYPIQAKRTRTVEITYMQSLTQTKGGGMYTLPLGYGDALHQFTLTMRVNGTLLPPKALGALGAITFTKDHHDYSATITKNTLTPTGKVTLLIPQSPQPKTTTTVYEGETYFVSEIPLHPNPKPRPLPRVVGVLWDSSGSMRTRAVEDELALLDRYFKTMQNGHVRLTRLRDRPEAVEEFTIVNGNWDSLRQALQNTHYDGASALSHWTPQADVQEYLLFSDGIQNYGSTPFPTLTAAQRLYAVSGSLSANVPFLRAITARNHGTFIPLTTQKSAMTALLYEGIRVESLRAHGAKEVVMDTREGEWLRVAGKLTAPHGELTLHLTNGGTKETITLPLSSTAPKNALGAYLWASYQLQTLYENTTLNKGEIRRIGERFGIATEETSLIVLDTLEDYLRYDLTPPVGEMEPFTALKNARMVTENTKRFSHHDHVLAMFHEKVAWWEKTHPKDTPPKPKEMVKSDAVMMDRMVGSAVPVVAMAMPAPVAVSMNESASAPQAPTATATTTIGIALKKWRSDAPYIARMHGATSDTIYPIYLDEKPSYENSSAFFLDAADMLIDKGQNDLARRVLSNLVEMELDNAHLLRILGYRLLQLKAYPQAIEVFQKVVSLSPEEPQTYRDLGLAYAQGGKYQEAIDQLNTVVERPWDGRFAEIELIALAEMNAIIAQASEEKIPLDLSAIDPEFLKNMPLDLRAVLTWDADNSDMDLWVTDPNGEKCYYGHRFTYQGGRMSRDFTGGYGPEEFSLRVAKKGKYRVEANFYGNRQQNVASSTTLQLNLITHFGTSMAKHQGVTLRLKERGETVFIGEFEVH